MSQWDKLIARLRNRPAEMQFSEIRKILEHLGYTATQPKGGSSHYVFRKKGKAPLTIPRHDPVPTPYIRCIQKAVEEEED